MQKQGLIYQTLPSSSGWKNYGHLLRGTSFAVSLLLNKRVTRSCHTNERTSCNHTYLDQLTRICTVQSSKVKSTANENTVDVLDEEDELCPVECVKEFNTDEELMQILEMAKRTDSLVVVDFYRTSCGSCKYIEQGFAKLCKGSGDQGQSVIFLKHNVIDEYDEQSEVADRLRIRTVPLFHFYKNGALLEAFATRDKERILAAIIKYTTPAGLDSGNTL